MVGCFSKRTTSSKNSYKIWNIMDRKWWSLYPFHDGLRNLIVMIELKDWKVFRKIRGNLLFRDNIIPIVDDKCITSDLIHDSFILVLILQIIWFFAQSIGLSLSVSGYFVVIFVIGFLSLRFISLLLYFTYIFLWYH